MHASVTARQHGVEVIDSCPPRSRRRRRTVIAIVAVSLSAILSACGQSSSATSGDGAAGWRYTDARGTEIVLDEVPDRIVATADTAPVLMEYGITPVGIIGFSRIDESTLQAFDFEGIAHVSETDTDINAEKLLSVDPDLVIDIWSSYNGGNFGSIWGEDIGRVEEVAPIAGVKITDGAQAALDDFRSLILGIGGTESTPVYSARRDDLRGLEDQVRELAAQRVDVDVAYVIPLQSSLDYAVPGWTPLGSLLEDLGVRFAQLDSEDGFWASATWEEPGAFPADLLLVPPTFSGTPELTSPTFVRLPAVAAGQVATVELRSGYSLTGITDQMRRFVDAYGAARSVV